MQLLHSQPIDFNWSNHTGPHSHETMLCLDRTVDIMPFLLQYSGPSTIQESYQIVLYAQKPQAS